MRIAGPGVKLTRIQESFAWEMPGVFDAGDGRKRA